MNRSPLPTEAPRRRMPLFSGVILAAIAVLAGLWLAAGQKRGLRDSELGTEEGKKMPVSRAKEVVSEGHRSGSHPSPQSSAGTNRQPQQFRAKPVEPAAVLAVLASGKQTVNERVRQLQGMRGIAFSKEESESALAFLAGKEVPGRHGLDPLAGG